MLYSGVVVTALIPTHITIATYSKCFFFLLETLAVACLLTNHPINHWMDYYETIGH